MYSVRLSESRTPSLSARILHEKHIEVQSRSPSTDLRRSPSLPEGGKGFVQISIFLQRISFVSIIMHNKIGIFYLNDIVLRGVLDISGVKTDQKKMEFLIERINQLYHQ